MKAKILEHRVRYRDTDSTGRIFFSRYLEFFDDATIEFFRSVGLVFVRDFFEQPLICW